MLPTPPPRAPSALPQWRWQAWTEADRARPDGAWTAAHAWLASLPGGPAGRLPMHRDAHGRPRFVATAAAVDAAVDTDADADAGWSHSGDGLLLAFAQGVVLGVDMEVERPRPNALAIARRYFAPAEVAWLEAQPGDAHAFLRLWCAKEAVLKAHGRGLAFGLHRLAFAERDGALVLADADPALGDPAAWSLHEFSPHPGYRAALAWRAAAT